MTVAQKNIATVGAVALLAILIVSWIRAGDLERDASRRAEVTDLLNLANGRESPPRAPITAGTVLAGWVVPIAGVVILAGLGMVLAAPKR